MKQMKVALPDDLRARLDAAGEKSGRSVAEEIRARIEASFARDAVVDKATRDFFEDLALLPAEIELETGAAWHKHAGSHAAFEQAILSRLARFKPGGPATFGPRPRATIATNDPNKLGVLIEGRLQQMPDFSSSPTRRLMEEEHRPRVEMMGSPRVLLDTPPKPDQPKKGRKR
jgi:hypothetical protein